MSNLIFAIIRFIRQLHPSIAIPLPHCRYHLICAQHPIYPSRKKLLNNLPSSGAKHQSDTIIHPQRDFLKKINSAVGCNAFFLCIYVFYRYLLPPLSIGAHFSFLLSRNRPPLAGLAPSSSYNLHTKSLRLHSPSLFLICEIRISFFPSTHSYMNELSPHSSIKQ
jgi:hypothetical protein